MSSKRVAVYTRSAQPNPGAIQAQREECQAWVQRQGYEVVETYESTGDHDRFLDLLNDISAHRFDAVVATEPTRFNRMKPKLDALARAAETAGVELHTVVTEEDSLEMLRARLNDLDPESDIARELLRVVESMEQQLRREQQLRAGEA